MARRKSDAFYQKDPSFQCKGRTRHCRKCGYDFIEDRLLWDCPVCGENRRCLNEAYYPWEYCRSHGPERGKASMKGGSQYPLANLAAKYLEAKSDGELLSTRRYISILDERLIQLLERVDSEDSDARRRELVDAWGHLRRKLQEESLSASTISTIERLDEIMTGVYHDYMSWNEIYQGVEQQRKLQESEVKRLKEMRQLLTAEEGFEIGAKLYAAVMEVFGDQPRKIKTLTTKFARIVGSGLDYEAERGSGETDGDRPSIVDSEEFLDS